MFLKKEINEKILEQELEVEKLLGENELLDHDIKTFFEKHHVTPDQLSQFIRERSNFSDSTWEILENEREKLEKTLESKLKQHNSPKRLSRPESDKEIQRHWIHAR